MFKNISSNKKNGIRIIFSIVLFITAVIIERIEVINSERISNGIFIVTYLFIGYDVLLRAVKNILKGKVFDENFLMTIATIGALVISQYSEAVGVMVFYQVGELFQVLAVNNSRKSIANLMNIRPDYANLVVGEDVKVVDPFDLAVNDEILIKVGEKVPVDCVITSGETTVDTGMLTGESIPRDVKEGMELLSGSINLTGIIKAKVTKEFSESTASKILELVEDASSNKSKSEHFISKFSKYYTPFVVISALILAVVPPLFFQGQWADWIYRAMTFLVISCPCALVISIPLSFFGGIGNASKKGILVKGSNYLEALSNVKTVVFDKTGTLTKGKFEVNNIVAVNGNTEQLLKITAYAESYTTHPIGKCIVEKYGKKIESENIKNLKELSGLGISCEIEGKKVLAGNQKLLENNNINMPSIENVIGTVILVAIDGEFAGHFEISDTVKSDSKLAIDKLKSIGIQTVMLTGDSKVIGEAVGKHLGIDRVYAELLPQNKVEIVEELIEKQKEKEKLVFVGDGINDAPVISRADIGMAMGGVGSDSAIEASDVVLMTDQLPKIYESIKISKKTLQIVKQNIVFSLFVKFSVLVLGAVGFASMWLAVFADVGVSVIAILNAIRVLKYKG